MSVNEKHFHQFGLLKITVNHEKVNHDGKWYESDNLDYLEETMNKY